jgi:glutathione S-transferase
LIALFAATDTRVREYRPGSVALKLYEFPPTRSIRVRWMLQELRVPFEAVYVDPSIGELRSPAFLALNPAGKLPVLVDGSLVLTESIAIVLYLGEKYPERGLIPTDLAQRAEFYRWILFAVTELEQPLWRINRHSDLYPEERRVPAEIPVARQDFVEMAAVLEAHMRGRDYVVGERVSAADFVLAYTLDWANEIQLLEDASVLRNYLERMYRRPQAPPRIAAALVSVGLRT